MTTESEDRDEETQPSWRFTANVAEGGSCAGDDRPRDRGHTSPRALPWAIWPVVVFGAEARGTAEPQSALQKLQGAFEATIAAGSEDAEIAGLLASATPNAGRVTVGDWPTWVASNRAQQHGGPPTAVQDANVSPLPQRVDGVLRSTVATSTSGTP